MESNGGCPEGGGIGFVKIGRKGKNGMKVENGKYERKRGNKIRRGDWIRL